MSIKNIRRNAYSAFRGSWWVLIVACFIDYAFSTNHFRSVEFIITRLSQAFKLFNVSGSFAELINSLCNTLQGNLVFSLKSTATLYLAFAGMILTMPLYMGICKVSLDLTDGKGKAKLKDTFVFYKGYFGKSVGLTFLSTIYILLWLLVPIYGIVKSLEYSMTSFIFTEEPDLPVNDIIKRSKTMMIGNKWKFVCLHLSLIGWMILDLLTLGLANVLYTPYYNLVLAGFYREIAGEKKKKKK